VIRVVSRVPAWSGNPHISITKYRGITSRDAASS
jgi:hypothetical protein